MKKFIALVCLVAGTVFGATPFLSVKAAQPSAEGMRSAYHILPVAGVGVRFPRSENLALRTELSGTYAQGVGSFSTFSLWNAGLRFGVEFNFSPYLDAYLVPGVMLAYAAERTPDADTLGNIGYHWYGGTSMGCSFDAGILLFRAGNWRFDIECGADVLSVPTDKPIIDPGWSPSWWHYSIQLSGFNLGLVVGMQ